jgi:hypothetical protein
MDSKQTITSSYSLKSLQGAINTIEQFLIPNEKAKFPSFYSLDICDGKLVAAPLSFVQKGVDIGKRVLVALFSSKLRVKLELKRIQMQNALLNAVETIKSHAWMIKKLREGSEEEQEAARNLLAIVERYNQFLQAHEKKSWKTVFVSSLQQLIGLSIDEEIEHNFIEIPSPLSVHIASAPNGKSALFHHKAKTEHHLLLSKTFSEKIAPLIAHAVAPAIPLTFKPTKQEIDAFRMKAITMMQQHLLSTPVHEALSSIKENLIEVHSENEDQSIISLHQTISPFPGEVIELIGSFKRSGQSAHSVPIKESFRFSSKSSQTGFPHPSQHTGWALADCMIPASPHRLDQLPIFRELYSQKKRMAAALLPDGSLINKARLLLRLKKQAFEEKKEYYISLHYNFCESVVKAFPTVKIPPNAFEIISAFHTHLRSSASPFEELSKAQEAIIQDFITAPFDYLQEEWLVKKNPELINPKEGSIAQAALKSIQNKIELMKETLERQKKLTQNSAEKIRIEYINCMGYLIGSGAASIILQDFSEKMEFPPPMLNDFERKLQTALYKQVIEFFDELGLKVDIDYPERNSGLIDRELKTMFFSDISIFKAETIDSLASDSLSSKAASIVLELEVYFNSRYYFRTQQKKLGKNKIIQE